MIPRASSRALDDALVFVAGLVEDQVSPGRKDFGMIGDLIDGGEAHAECSRRPGVVGLVPTRDLAKRVQVATARVLVNLPRDNASCPPGAHSR